MCIWNYYLIVILKYFIINLGNQTSSSSSSANNVNCPICSELVSGKRFAPHLEKCMNGGKRGSKRHYDYLHDDASSNHANSKTVNKQKSNESQDQQDAHPLSLVVRIRMKNGGKHHKYPATSLLFTLTVVLLSTPDVLCTLQFRRPTRRDSVPVWMTSCQGRWEARVCIASTKTRD